MSLSYAEQFINSIYEIGEFDDEFFFHLCDEVNRVNLEEGINPKSVNLNKFQSKQFFDALSIVKFLMQHGDFCGVVYETFEIPPVLIENFEDFSKIIQEKYSKYPDAFFGIEGDYRYCLRKIKRGAKAPVITKAIEDIFKVEL